MSIENKVISGKEITSKLTRGLSKMKTHERSVLQPWDGAYRQTISITFNTFRTSSQFSKVDERGEFKESSEILNTLGAAKEKRKSVIRTVSG